MGEKFDFKSQSSRPDLDKQYWACISLSSGKCVGLYDEQHNITGRSGIDEDPYVVGSVEYIHSVYKIEQEVKNPRMFRITRTDFFALNSDIIEGQEDIGQQLGLFNLIDYERPGVDVIDGLSRIREEMESQDIAWHCSFVNGVAYIHCAPKCQTTPIFRGDIDFNTIPRQVYSTDSVIVRMAQRLVRLFINLPSKKPWPNSWIGQPGGAIELDDRAEP